jgi:hypothetical protein
MEDDDKKGNRSSDEEEDGGVANKSQLTDREQVVQLLKGLAFCRNSVVSRKFARERVLDAAVAKLRAQTTVVERLKAELKTENDKLSVVRAFSQKSTAVYDSRLSAVQCVPPTIMRFGSMRGAR